MSKDKEVLAASQPTTTNNEGLGSMVGVSASPGPQLSSSTLKGGYLTILSDAVNYHVKHPLQSHWTLHQKLGRVDSASSRGASKEDWANKLKKSVTIGTVEDFWCVYNSMQEVKDVPDNCDYFFMREGIEPMWEDPANKGGCELRLVITRNMDEINMWKLALLAVVGCQFTDYEFITGAQFAWRTNKNRISLWLAAAPEEIRARIKGEFSTIMEKASGIDTGLPLRIETQEFNAHPPSSRGGGDRRGSDNRGGDRGDRNDRGDRGDRGDHRGDRDDRGGWGRNSGGGGGGPGGMRSERGSGDRFGKSSTAGDREERHRY